ncbi:hypothetical protein OB13_05765 [Pontibacter sp. HJ8]
MKFIVLEESQYQNLINKIDSLYEIVAGVKISKEPEDRLMTTTEAAKRLKVCNKTVINLIESGKLKAIKYNKGEGRRGHFKLLSSDLERFIKNKRLGY